jgi:hypothetical protein
MSILPKTLKPTTTFRNLEIRLDTPIVYASLFPEDTRDSNLQVRGRVVMMNDCELPVKEFIVSLEGKCQVLYVLF